MSDSAQIWIPSWQEKRSEFEIQKRLNKAFFSHDCCKGCSKIFNVKRLSNDIHKNGFLVIEIISCI